MQAAQPRPEERSLFEKPWFLGVLIAVLAVLALAFWYIQGHQDQVIHWLGQDKGTTEKPSAPKPTAAPAKPQP